MCDIPMTRATAQPVRVRNALPVTWDPLGARTVTYIPGRTRASSASPLPLFTWIVTLSFRSQLPRSCIVGRLLLTIAATCPRA